MSEACDEFYTLPVEDRTRIREKLRYLSNQDNPLCKGTSIKTCPGWHTLRIGGYRLVVEVAQGSVFIRDVKYVGIIRIMAVGLRNSIYRLLRDRYEWYN